jgi:hypothetical protein
MSRDPELGRPERQANARLIALAPRMAEALMKSSAFERHHHSCSAWLSPAAECDCGLEDLRAVVAELEKI